MRYAIDVTNTFDAWLSRLDGSLKKRLAYRFLQIERGNFGDHKLLAENLFELRFTFGGGLRIYYTLNGQELVLLLSGGNKDSQEKDIAKAKTMLAKLE